MNPAAMEYIKGRVVSAIPTVSGEITTNTVITLDNGDIIEGCAIRDISTYEKAEADNAAFQDAMKTFYPGVNLMLTKP